MATHVVCPIAQMTYFPGGDIQNSLLDSDGYKKLRSRRAAKVIEFIRSGHYRESVLKADLSSIHRWRFVREINTDPESKSGQERTRTCDDDEVGDDSDDGRIDYVSVSEDLRGLARGQRGFLEDCRRIMAGKDNLAEYFLRREGTDKPYDSKLGGVYIANVPFLIRTPYADRPSN